jgi:hypothetical protein
MKRVKHLSPILQSAANEYDTSLLNSILEIPKLDQEAFTNMIRYARINNFKILMCDFSS